MKKSDEGIVNGLTNAHGNPSMELGTHQTMRQKHYNGANEVQCGVTRSQYIPDNEIEKPHGRNHAALGK